MEINGPKLLNIYKPAGASSFDVVRHFKKRLTKKYKIGHFGTLDPFAEGVLILGINGAQRLNEQIHDCLSKTYIATGILGQETESGDLDMEVSQVDDSDYLKNEISKFSNEFIEEFLNKKFLGEYWQAPHKYSAAKYQGKNLHEWARLGVEIKKEKKRRHIYKIEVLEYNFPELKIRFEVSSGTYIRTLFSECAKELGTLGVLKNLVRESVGPIHMDTALRTDHWEQKELPFLEIQDALKFSSYIFEDKEARLYSNGVKLKQDRAARLEVGELQMFNYFWAKNLEGKILGLCQIDDEEQFKQVVNFNF